MRRLEGGDWKSASTGNSLVAYPTSSTVLKTSGASDSLAEFNQRSKFQPATARIPQRLRRSGMATMCRL
ncbi:hypothetical protein ACKFKG_21990 [Phormidesmis sp. 146-35]